MVGWGKVCALASDDNPSIIAHACPHLPHVVIPIRVVSTGSIIIPHGIPNNQSVTLVHIPCNFLSRKVDFPPREISIQWDNNCHETVTHERVSTTCSVIWIRA
jgi:hypothetical protein